jgi:hypothetical protein
MTRLSLRVKWWQLRDRLLGLEVIRPVRKLSDQELTALRERWQAQYRSLPPAAETIFRQGGIDEQH